MKLASILFLTLPLAAQTVTQGKTAQQQLSAPTITCAVITISSSVFGGSKQYTPSCKAAPITVPPLTVSPQTASIPAPVPGPQGIQGPPGSAGAQGPPGPPATLPSSGTFTITLTPEQIAAWNAAIANNGGSVTGLSVQIKVGQ